LTLKKKVKNILRDYHKFNNIKNAFYKFNNYFPITIIDFCGKNNSYNEKYIDFTPCEYWGRKEKDSVINKVFNYYNNYFRQNKLNQKDKISTQQLFKSFKRSSNLQELKNIIEEILSDKDFLKLEWPIVPVHGDLGFHNILLAESQLYFIDWEDWGKHILFYDLLNMMFFEYAFHGDNTYIKKFIRGHYDEEFESIFKVMDIKYKHNMKMKYFTLFLVERMLSEKKMNADHLPRMHNLCLECIKELVRLQN